MDWYPWYPQLYEADTMHLNPYQDGCYRRLIDHYMKTRSPLADNDSALARIVGDSEANWVAMASLIVRPFFKAKNGMLYQFRCEAILNDQDARSKKFSESGRNGAKKRWNKINGKDSHPIATPIAFDSTLHHKTSQDKIRSEKKDFLNMISDDGWMDARAQAPGHDINYLAAKYSEAINSGKLESPRNINKAFPAWCKSITKGKRPP